MHGELPQLVTARCYAKGLLNGMDKLRDVQLIQWEHPQLVTINNHRRDYDRRRYCVFHIEDYSSYCSCATYF